MKPEDLLGKPFIQDYNPEAIQGYFLVQSRRPPFSQRWIPTMLRDSRVQFGLRIIKGTCLAGSRFYIEDPDSQGAEHSELKEFLIKNIVRFWRWSAIKAMRAVEWGFSGTEAMFNVRKDLVCFDNLRSIHPKDVKVLTVDGEKVGVSVRNVKGHRGRVYLGGPKGFWHVQNREDFPYYGLSQLFGSFEPWLEFYSDGGAKDVRRLYYHKYAFSGETGYFPVNTEPSEAGGPGATSNRDTMRGIMEKRRAGAATFFPNRYDAQGNKEWEIIPAQAGPGSGDLLEYHRDLKGEIFEGMGIPSEVVEAAEVGSGWAGRRVPQTAFFSILQDIVNWLIFDFDSQILRPLVTLNFGIKDPEYEIVPFGLLEGTGEQERKEWERQGTPLPGQEGAAPIPEERRQAAQFSLVV